MLHVLFVFSTMLLHQVFGNIGLVPTEDIDRHNNFRTFLSGLLLLFRQDISTIIIFHTLRFILFVFFYT